MPATAAALPLLVSTFLGEIALTALVLVGVGAVLILALRRSRTRR